MCHSPAVTDRDATPKAHPATDIETRSRGVFASIIKQLGLEFGAVVRIADVGVSQPGRSNAMEERTSSGGFMSHPERRSLEIRVSRRRTMRSHTYSACTLSNDQMRAPSPL